MQRPKTILITGASSGIGAATALAAAAEGYDVAITYKTDQDGAENTARKIRDMGRKAVVIKADVSNPDDVEDMFDIIDDEFDELGVLVNNAGVVDQPQRVEEMSAERLKRMFEVNTIGPFLCAKQAAIRMAYRYGGAGGVIVNGSSIAARLGSAGH
jgi:glucose 1-dehydrogenase